jgi:UDP-N-acetylglucosamine/UDP-N-acetylgalactosamine diphosphorylase
MTISSSLPISESEFYALKERFESNDQGHVFQFFEGLEPEQQAKLVSQLLELDVKRLNQIYHKAVEGAEAAVLNTNSTFEPLPDNVFESVSKSSPQQLREWETLGLTSIAEGKVAVILMAGGQGTRLGSSDPKGCYNINLPTEKSLFQLQAERILRLQEIARQYRKPDQVDDCVIPWYIMTSGPTHGPTYNFFEKNNFFGLKKENVIFFQQGKRVQPDLDRGFMGFRGKTPTYIILR